MDVLITLTEHGKINKIPLLEVKSVGSEMRKFHAILVHRSIILGCIVDNVFSEIVREHLSPIEIFLFSTKYNNLHFISQLANKDDYRDERELFTFSIIY